MALYFWPPVQIPADQLDDYMATGWITVESAGTVLVETADPADPQNVAYHRVNPGSLAGVLLASGISPLPSSPDYVTHRHFWVEPKGRVIRFGTHGYRMTPTSGSADFQFAEVGIGGSRVSLEGRRSSGPFSNPQVETIIKGDAKRGADGNAWLMQFRKTTSTFLYGYPFVPPTITRSLRLVHPVAGVDISQDSVPHEWLDIQLAYDTATTQPLVLALTTTRLQSVMIAPDAVTPVNLAVLPAEPTSGSLLAAAKINGVTHILARFGAVVMAWSSEAVPWTILEVLNTVDVTRGESFLDEANRLHAAYRTNPGEWRLAWLDPASGMWHRQSLNDLPGGIGSEVQLLASTIAGEPARHVILEGEDQQPRRLRVLWFEGGQWQMTAPLDEVSPWTGSLPINASVRVGSDGRTVVAWGDRSSSPARVMVAVESSKLSGFVVSRAD